MSDILTLKMSSDEGKIVINNYLVWHTVKALTCCVSKAFRDAEKILRKAILGSDGERLYLRFEVGYLFEFEVM
jgi:endothelin-converting enzyme